jgi:2-keto-4-pentenoate hydratase/2-oxohepta-3-ene-1,7-dioic acid hydratase in catechol pathway
MKIICFSNIDRQVKMVLKGDSSLLVNHKPFFIPDWSEDIRMTPCVVLRVSRLGKNIGSTFANRYYDAVALGLNIYAADWVAKGDSIRGWAFDYSLPLGKWMNIDKNPWTDLIISMDEAIEQASKVMTIRQGDMIVIDRNMASRQLDREEVIQITENEEELLFCKIK